MELMRGVRSKSELLTTRQFFVDLEIRLIPIDEQISYTAANLVEDHCFADGLGITDALIAAPRETGQTLATGNFRHFRRIPNLSVKKFRPAR
jgi:predicted nucleic acid-binding protein